MHELLKKNYSNIFQSVLVFRVALAINIKSVKKCSGQRDTSV